MPGAQPHGQNGVHVLRMLAVGSGTLGVFAVGDQATGIIALGQEATGVLAIGQLATGVIAVGQLARGFVVVGQLAIGLAVVGQGAFGVVWAMGMLGVGGTAGPSLAVLGLFGRPRWRRLLASLRREPWDAGPATPAWRLAIGVTGVAALAALWWFVAGQPVVAALS